jgi:hypothetical protein
LEIPLDAINADQNFELAPIDLSNEETAHYQSAHVEFLDQKKKKLCPPQP